MLHLVNFPLPMRSLSYFTDIPIVSPYIGMRAIMLSLVKISLHMQSLSYFTDIPIASPLYRDGGPNA